MTRDKGRNAPDSHSDNLVPFPLSDVTAGRLLAASAGAAARSPAADIATAWALVRDIGIEDGETALALATAIGCLCCALTPPTGAPADGEDRP